MNWKKEAIRWRAAFHALEDDYARGKVRKKAKPAKKRVIKKATKKRTVKNARKAAQGSFDFML